MQRRCRRSLNEDMIKAGESLFADVRGAESGPRTRSRSKVTEHESPARKLPTPSRKKRARGEDEERTASKRRHESDEYQLPSSAEDSDASSRSSGPIRSFYGGGSKRYLSPLERSRLKIGIFSDSDSDVERGPRPLLKERNKITPPGWSKVTSHKKANLKNEGTQNKVQFKTGAPENRKSSGSGPKLTTSLPLLKDENRPSINSSTKRFFKHGSPGKKMNFMNASITSKGGFKLSFQSRKVKPGSTPTKNRDVQKSVTVKKTESNTRELCSKPDACIPNDPLGQEQMADPENVLTSENTVRERSESLTEDDAGESGERDGASHRRDRVGCADAHDAGESEERASASQRRERVGHADTHDAGDSGRASVASVISTDGDNWSTISNESSLMLLPELSHTSPCSSSPARASPASGGGGPSSRHTPTTPSSRISKMKAFVSSRSNSPSLQAEDFLPTPEKPPACEDDGGRTYEPPPAASSPSRSVDESAKLYPIFSRRSSRRLHSTGDVGTPDSSASCVYDSQATPGSSRMCQSPAGTPMSGVSVFLTKYSTPRRSPRKLSPAVTPRSSGKSTKLWKKLQDKDGLSQMTLDFGQKLQAVEPCARCGMTYTRGDPTDEATHAHFHARLTNTLRFKGWQKERVAQQYEDGSRVVVVLPEEKLSMKKVEAVKRIVDEDLGFVVENRGQKSHSKAYLFVSPENKIVGFCIAELISQGYRVITEEEIQNEGSPTKRRRPWCASTHAQPARCGVNRIWVLRSERRSGVATKLLDCVRFNFIMGYALKKSELAFSDPTPDGRQFATKYTADPHFLVYKH